MTSLLRFLITGCVLVLWLAVTPFASVWVNILCVVAVAVAVDLIWMTLVGPPLHCWVTLQSHSWAWRMGLHRLYQYRYCARCGWPGGTKRVEGGPCGGGESGR